MPRKNVKLLIDKPLIAHGIETLLASDVVDRVVVATEDKEIAEIAKIHGAEIVTISEELANGTTEPVMLFALETLEKEGYRPDFVSLMQCTSPFVTPEIVQQVVKKVCEGNDFDSCITVFKPTGYEFKWRAGENGLFIPEHDVNNRPRRQFLNLPHHENGAFYITRTELLKKTKNRFGGNEARITAVEMSEEDSLQIDTPYNFWLAERLMETRKKKKNF